MKNGRTKWYKDRGSLLAFLSLCLSLRHPASRLVVCEEKKTFCVKAVVSCLVVFVPWSPMYATLRVYIDLEKALQALTAGDL